MEVTFGHKLTSGGDSRTINQVPLNLIGPGNSQVKRPFPQFSDVRVRSPTIGNSNYHGMNARLEKRYAAGLQFSANFTWAKAIDDVASRNELGGNGTSVFANQYDRHPDRGLSGNNVGRRFIASAVWELPLGKGKRLSIGNRLLNAVAGGWSTGLILESRTGSPFTAAESNAGGVYPTAQAPRSTAIGAYGANPNWRSDVLRQTFFNTAVFVTPAIYTFGTLGRSVATGPGAFIGDVSILKDFSFLHERHTLQFRTEMLNFANHPNFALPDQGHGNASFGRVSSLIGGNQARIIQFGLHYKF